MNVAWDGSRLQIKRLITKESIELLSFTLGRIPTKQIILSFVVLDIYDINNFLCYSTSERTIDAIKRYVLLQKHWDKIRKLTNES